MSAENDIRDLLGRYEMSLNRSDPELSAACYTRDGVFMPARLPTIAGAEMREGYARIFEKIRLNVEFRIQELVIASNDLAFALTQSQGTQTVLATAEESVESNREMFVFRSDEAAWKIARYMFNKAE